MDIGENGEEDLTIPKFVMTETDGEEIIMKKPFTVAEMRRLLKGVRSTRSVEYRGGQFLIGSEVEAPRPRKNTPPGTYDSKKIWQLHGLGVPHEMIAEMVGSQKAYVDQIIRIEFMRQKKESELETQMSKMEVQ